MKEKIFELAGSQDQSVLNIIISANKVSVEKIKHLKAFVDIRPLLEFKDKTLCPPKNPLAMAVEIGDESLVRKLIEVGSKATPELVQTVKEDSLKALLRDNMSNDTEDYQKLMTDISQCDEQTLARQLSRHLKKEMVRGKKISRPWQLERNMYKFLAPILDIIEKEFFLFTFKIR